MTPTAGGAVVVVGEIVVDVGAVSEEGAAGPDMAGEELHALTASTVSTSADDDLLNIVAVMSTSSPGTADCYPQARRIRVGSICAPFSAIPDLRRRRFTK
ncbi:hypothetical protein [Actinosynnema sp. NPDC023587]|uniref:hypothetical protein n=1 Tax=Actinosynnema sp. NPDC023587 TaxID=3154695 RepID=UPI0033EF8CE3